MNKEINKGFIFESELYNMIIKHPDFKKLISLMFFMVQHQRYSLFKKNIYCRCDYNVKLLEIVQEMYELSEAQKALKDAAELDYYLGNRNIYW